MEHSPIQLITGLQINPKNNNSTAVCVLRRDQQAVANITRGTNSAYTKGYQQAIAKIAGSRSRQLDFRPVQNS